MAESGLRILVVDDEAAIRRFLRASLSAHAHSVFEAASGEEGIRAVVDHRPDLVILDLGLPDMSGVEVARRLREWTQIPILILSVRGAEADKVEALDAGADDYLTKPFGVRELLARIRVAMRRASPSPPDAPFTSGSLSMDLVRRSVTVDGRPVQLTPTEYDLLRALVHQAGKVLTHRQLLREVWGTGYELDTHTLRVNVSNLRRKLEPDPSRPRFVVTEPGVGYRLRTEAEG
jgi:two-component system KDP operon response regulator KdpE